MTFDEFLYRHDDFILQYGRALGYPYGEVIKFLRIHLKPLAVAMQEHKQRRQGNPLVTILERISLNQQVKQDAPFRRQ